MNISDELIARHLLSMGARALTKQQCADEWDVSKRDARKIIDAAVARGEVQQVAEKVCIGRRWVGAKYALTAHAAEAIATDCASAGTGHGSRALQEHWTRAAVVAASSTQARAGRSASRGTA